MEDSQELDKSEIARRLSQVNEGDRIRFNDRAKPLKVISTDRTVPGAGGEITGVLVEGDQGGQYVLSSDGKRFRSLGSSGYRRDLWWFERLNE